MAPAFHLERAEEVYIKHAKLGRARSTITSQWFDIASSTNADPTGTTPTLTTTSDRLPTQTSSVLVGPTPQNDSSLKITAVVATALVVSIILLVFGGEILRRRKAASQSPVTRASRAPQPDGLMNQTNNEARTKGEGICCDEKAWNSPRATCPSDINASQRRGLKRLFSAFTRNKVLPEGSMSSPPIVHFSEEPTGPQLPAFDWDQCNDVPSPRHEPSRLHSIPEESEAEFYRDSVSDVALSLGLAMQRTFTTNPLLSPPSGLFVPKAYSSTRSEQDSFLQTEVRLPFGSDDADESRDTQDTSISTETSAGDRQDDQTTSSSMTSLRSTGSETECEPDSRSEEVFELRRVQTRSMQMNKAVLISVDTSSRDKARKSLYGIVGSLPYPHSFFMDAYDDGTLTKSVSESISIKGKRQFGDSDRGFTLAKSNSDSSISIDSFPSPPSYIFRFPTFLSQ